MGVLRRGIGLRVLLAAYTAAGATRALAQDVPHPEALVQGFTMHEYMLDGLPSGREFWSLLRTLEPTVVADRIEAGGLFLGQPALLGVHGQSWTETRITLGEIEITDPERGGTPLLLVPAEALQQVSLSTALDRGGPRVALLPHQVFGPNRLRILDPAWRQLALGMTPYVAPEGRGVAPSVARLSSWSDIGLSAGSAARDGRLRLFASLRGTRSARTERGAPDRLPTSLASVLTRAAYSPNEQTEWTVLAAGSAVERPFAGRARRSDVRASEGHAGIHLQSSLTRWSRAGQKAWSLALGYQHEGRTPPDAAPGPPATVERLRDGPVLEMYAPRRRIGRGDLVATAYPRFLRLGSDRHPPVLRFELERSRVAWRPVPGATSGLTAERVSDAPARLWDVHAPPTDTAARVTRLTLGLHDQIRVHRVLYVEAGAAFDRWSGFREGTPGRIEWTTVSPSLGVRFRPVSFASLYGGWEGFAPRLHASYLQWGDPAGMHADVYRWNDDGDLVFAPHERGARVAVAGPAAPVSALDPDLRSPYTQGVVAGIDLGPFKRWRVRFAGVKRTTRDYIESLQTGLTEDDYAVTFVPDPAIDIVGPADDRPLPIFARRPASFGRDRYRLTNVPGHDVTHENVELFIDGRPTRNLFFRVGGTASRTTGAGGNHGYGALENDPGVIGEVMDTPNAATYASGRMFFDRAYTLKLAGWWNPRDWQLSLVAQYQDGQPFARVVLARDLPQGAEAIPAIRRSEHRFTFTMTVDARLERSFWFGPREKGRGLALSIEVFNLPDMKNEVEEDVVWGPSFRAVTAVQPPRAVRVGARLHF